MTSRDDEDYADGVREGQTGGFFDSFMQSQNFLDAGSPHDKGYWYGAEHKYDSSGERYHTWDGKGKNDTPEETHDIFAGLFGSSDSSKASSDSSSSSNSPSSSSSSSYSGSDYSYSGGGSGGGSSGGGCGCLALIGFFVLGIIAGIVNDQSKKSKPSYLATPVPRQSMQERVSRRLEDENILYSQRRPTVDLPRRYEQDPFRGLESNMERMIIERDTFKMEGGDSETKQVQKKYLEDKQELAKANKAKLESFLTSLFDEASFIDIKGDETSFAMDFEGTKKYYRISSNDFKRVEQIHNQYKEIAEYVGSVRTNRYASRSALKNYSKGAMKHELMRLFMTYNRRIKTELSRADSHEKSSE